jgi:hypothetical protein
MKALESTAAWRHLGDFFLTICIPIFHWTGGFFLLEFVLSGQYTWGRTLRTFALFMGNVVMAYEFVYRDQQTVHPDWSQRVLVNTVMKYSVWPFMAGMAVAVIVQVIRYWGK